MIRLVIFFLFIVMFSIFAVASAVLLYHFINFRFTKNQHNLLIISFIATSFILGFFEFSLFFSINWDAVASFISEKIHLPANSDIVRPPF